MTADIRNATAQERAAGIVAELDALARDLPGNFLELWAYATEIRILAGLPLKEVADRPRKSS